MTQRLKNAFLALAMFVLVAAMVAPVMAASASGTTVISGNPTGGVNISISTASFTMTLVPELTNHYTSATLTVSANGPATIQAVDPGTESKPYKGYMVNTTTSGNNWQPGYLENLMGITGTNAGVFTTTPVTDLSTASTLYTSSTYSEEQVLALSFNQYVSFDDPRLPTGYTYRIPVTFTMTNT
jgi:hypothetical protein